MPWVLSRLSGEASDDGTTQWRMGATIEVTDKEKEAAFEALRALEEDAEQEPMNLLLRHFQEFFWYKGHLEAACEQLLSSGEMRPVRRVQSELRGRMFTWLQSARAFLDHTEARLKRTYGKDADEVKRFKDACSRMYDGYFAYRFFYKLRNAQHVDFAPIRVRVSESIAGSNAVARFNREELLNSYDAWGPVADDLRDFPKDFSIDEHVFTMMQCLDRIAYDVTLIDRPLLEDHVRSLQQMHSRVRSGAGAPVLAYLPEAGEPLDRMEYRALPAGNLKELGPVPQIVGRASGRGDDWSIS